MPEILNLNGKEAIEKLRMVAENIKVCMFCTKLEEQPFATRPMLIQEIDDQGDIWFLSSDVSDKNVDVKMDDKVQLLFSNHKANQYLTVYGSAYVYNDRKIIENKAAHSVKAWIPKGTEDPFIALIRIIPEKTFYWDAKLGHLVI